MATRKTKGSKVKKLGTSAKRQKVARAKARSFRTAVRRAVEKTTRKKLMKIRYVRTTTGRVRFIPLEGTLGSKQSYASRQGARRAARKLYKGLKVVAVVAA